MNHNNRKRKHRSAYTQRKPSPGASEYQFLGHHELYHQTHDLKDPEAQNELDPLRQLFIQAYEADVVHGPSAEAAARSLEVVEYRVAEDGTVERKPNAGSSLIQWGISDPDVGEDSIPSARRRQGPVWVDRYDARLLLDSDYIPLNVSEYASESCPPSPSGWSDIPSDTEDMFFFTPDEIEDFHREKRRRLLERTREERLKARLEEDGVEEVPQDEDIWGGTDEEPDDAQKELMHRTAAHLLSSPNPAQLEMRILTNHGADRRFGFLRGRWKRAWNLAKAKVRVEKAKADDEERARKAEKANPKPAGLGIVVGYGSDSDDVHSSAGDDGEDETKNNVLPNDKRAIVYGQTAVSEQPPPGALELDGAAKEAKRKRLREWMEKRRAEKKVP